MTALFCAEVILVAVGTDPVGLESPRPWSPVPALQGVCGMQAEQTKRRPLAGYASYLGPRQGIDGMLLASFPR